MTSRGLTNAKNTVVVSAKYAPDFSRHPSWFLFRATRGGRSLMAESLTASSFSMPERVECHQREGQENEGDG